MRLYLLSVFGETDAKQKPMAHCKTEKDRSVRERERERANHRQVIFIHLFMVAFNSVAKASLLIEHK